MTLTEVTDDDLRKMGAFRSSWERRLGKVESPIEALFLEAFCVAAVEHGYGIARKSAAREGVIVVGIQRSIGERYRADFLISYPFFGAHFAVVVECDGHAFHERTKKQAARDRRRDRDIQRMGYQIFRFTGSELNADARGCAVEVLTAIEEFQTSTILKAMKAADEEAA